MIFLGLGVLAFYFLVKMLDESENPKKAIIYFFFFITIVCSLLEAVATGLGLILLVPIIIGVMIYGIFK